MKTELFFVKMMNCDSGDMLFGVADSKKNAEKLATEMIWDFIDWYWGNECGLKNEVQKKIQGKSLNFFLKILKKEYEVDYDVEIINLKNKINKICWRYE